MTATPREEVDYQSLYGNLLNIHAPLSISRVNSREVIPESLLNRQLPVLAELSGQSWTKRLQQVKESLPRPNFKVTRPTVQLVNNVTTNNLNNDNNSPTMTMLSLEIPKKRGRGRPRKDSTTVITKISDSNKNSGNNGSGLSLVAAGEIGIERPPLHYLRHIENPCESVEYDMDEQDLMWLKLFNEQQQSNNQVNEDVFESVIDELEKGWDRLTGPIKKFQHRSEASLYPEEMPCEICAESDTTNCNVIVMCDDCDLAVHQECYGIPHIPEGPWLCRTCTLKRGNLILKDPKCILCPWTNGALRPTSDHRWVHVLCAHLIPETANTFSPAEPDDLVDVFMINPERFKLKCVLCRVDYGNGGGAPVQCASKCCTVAMHPLCARKVGWPVNFTDKRLLCGRHLTNNNNNNSNESGDELGVADSEKSLKIRLPNEATLSPSMSLKDKFPLISIDSVPPLHVPRSTTAAQHKFRIKCIAPAVLVNFIVEKIEESNLSENERTLIVQRIAKYWSLKREARRGTPLLKSLQLEPSWSECKLANQLSDFEQENLTQQTLLCDLHNLRSLMALVREREELKLTKLQAEMEIIEILTRPFHVLVTDFIKYLRDHVDIDGFFKVPVPLHLFPDYSTIVRYPMDFTTILTNLMADQNGNGDFIFYPTLRHVYIDCRLITENAKAYNAEGSVYYEAAGRLETSLNELIGVLEGKMRSLGIIDYKSILNQDVVIADDDDKGMIVDSPKSSVERYNDYYQLMQPKVPLKPIGSMTAKPKLIVKKPMIQSVTEEVNGVKRKRGRPPKVKPVITIAVANDNVGEQDAGDIVLEMSEVEGEVDLEGEAETEMEQKEMKGKVVEIVVSNPSPGKTSKMTLSPSSKGSRTGTPKASLSPSKSKSTSPKASPSKSKISSQSDSPKSIFGKSKSASPKPSPSGSKSASPITSKGESPSQGNSLREGLSTILGTSPGKITKGCETASTSPSKGKSTGRSSKRTSQKSKTGSCSEISSPSLVSPKSKRRRTGNGMESTTSNTIEPIAETKTPKSKEEFLRGLAWTKLKGFPYYPVNIVDLSRRGASKQVPDSLFKSKPSESSILVRFFDSSRNYSWILSKNLVDLSRDFEADVQRLKVSGNKTMREAHEAALCYFDGGKK